MLQNRYITDILNQAQALQALLDTFDGAPCRSLHQDLQAGRFDRIILTGMGSSTYGTYPAWLDLVRQGLPVWTVETGELLHYASDLITPRTLLWITSQSGHTIEAVTLLEKVASRRPAFVLATTNEPDSPLAQGADAVLELHAGDEFTVSTKTYLNTLAVAQLAGLGLIGAPVEPALQDLQTTQAGIEAFLQSFEANLAEVASQAGQLERLFLLARGPSLATAETGSLTLKESTKFPVSCISAGQFRHGPLEIADSRLTAVLFQGQPATADLNNRLGQELVEYGARVLWIGHQPPAGVKPLPMPAWAGIGMPLAEMLPLQMLSIALAGQNGVEPGIFRHIAKVTLAE